MTRSIVALMVSLLAHILMLINLSLPAASLNIPDAIQIRITNPPTTQMVEMPGEIPESLYASEVSPSIETQQPAEIHDPEPAIDAIEQPLETSVYEEESEAAELNENTEIDEGIENPTGDGNLGDMENGGGLNEPGEDVHRATSSDGSEVNGNESDTGQVRPDLDQILAHYRDRVHSAISNHKKYPATAKRLGQEGVVQVRFRVSIDGTVSLVEIESSSGVDSLDDAARDAVIDAGPVPPIPEELKLDTLTLSILIVFNLD